MYLLCGGAREAVSLDLGPARALPSERILPRALPRTTQLSVVLSHTDSGGFFIYIELYCDDNNCACVSGLP